MVASKVLYFVGYRDSVLKHVSNPGGDVLLGGGLIQMIGILMELDVAYTQG